VVTVQVLYVEGCPSWRLAVERVQAAVQAMGLRDAEVDAVRVESAGAAAERGFAGSPTILAGGRDLFPGASPVPALSCRIYETAEGPQGAPTVGADIEALERNLGSSNHIDDPESSI
jgi:hypothetical protein